MDLQKSEIPIQSKFEKSGKNEIHPHLILLWIKQPSIKYCDLASLAVFFDCFQYDGGKHGSLVEGLSEELFFAVPSKNEEEVFFYYELVRYVQQIMSYKDQKLLLQLLRERELE